MEEWIKIIHIESLDSTNEYAAKIKKETNLPFLVYTDYQTQGKGQGLNVWESEKAENLLASAVIAPLNLEASKNFFISKITALSVFRTLSDYVNQLVIKWPNDILCKGKKICGILIENSLLGGDVVNTIIGTGINLNQTVFGEMDQKPTSLRIESGRKYDKKEVLYKYLDYLKYYLDLLNAGDLDTINKEYFSQLLNYKKWSEYIADRKKFEGMIIDVMDDGFLILKCRDGENRKFGFGEIVQLYQSCGI